MNLVTDGPPATALGFNPPDPNAMNQPPRPTNEPILSNWLFIRYLLTGFYVGIATISVFIWWYVEKGISLDQLLHWNQCPVWDDFQLPSSVIQDLANMDNMNGINSDDLTKNPCEIFETYVKKPQTMALTTLITIEMLKALSAISLNTSLFKLPPWKNPWLIVGVLVPFALHLMVLYTPTFSYIFGLNSLSFDEWKIILSFALPIVILEEILKSVGRSLKSSQSNTSITSIQLPSLF